MSSVLQGDAAKALEAFKSGQNVAAAVYGTNGASGSPEDVSHGLSEDDVVVREEAILDPETTDDSSPLAPPVQAEGSKDKKTPSSSGNKKKLAVDKGKAQIEIDYDDREKIDDAFLKAHGFRKAFAERDQVQKKYVDLESRYKELDTKHSEVSANFGRLEEAFQSKGIEGVIDLLERREGAYKDHVRRAVEKAKYLESASPEEVKALEAQEQALLKDRELARIRKEHEDFIRKVETEREQAETRALESRVHPSFEKHRFKGRLGDATDEHMFDEMLWNTAMKRLEPYEAKGIEITSEMVDKEFGSVAAVLRKRIAVQADKATSRAISKKKQDATESAQAKVMSGYRNDSVKDEASALINSGNLSKLLGNWGKYGSLFNK